MKNKGQITVFIIIAIVIVAGIAIFFVFRDKIFVSKLPARFQPIENYFLTCIEDKAIEAKNILGQQGGYIYPPEFQAGSSFSPFSNMLDFYGSGVPYWYYISGNNLVKEQVPGRQKMEDQLDKYIEENLDCDFSGYEQQGYTINFSKPKVSTTINDYDIQVNVQSDLDMSRESESARQTSHKTSISTRTGKFYSEALKIYNYEKQNSFLENYAVDVLRNYAPVDGVEISCSPKTWNARSVFLNLQEALEANMQAINAQGKSKEKYFNLDLTDEQVNFMYNANWPSKMEVWNADNGIMIAEPVGTQAGLGILGFCYVPYHFVYDIKYPVLVQIFNENEIFQFPVAVIIDKNKPRNALNATAIPEETELCNYMNSDISVYSYDNKLEPVEADISFECLGERCDIGRTVINNEADEAVLKGKFPQCINGFITAKADGYARKRVQFSSNIEGSVDIVLDKLFNVTVNLKVDNKDTDDFAVITFLGENGRTLVWPEQKELQLSEGFYNISVFVYRNSSIIIPGTKSEKCAEVPKSGILGVFGATEEKCFTVDIPSQTLTSLVSGGGKTQDYFTDDMLEKGVLEVQTSSIPVPRSIEQLQESYMQLEVNSVYIEAKEE
ncbi:hypothetical protein FJZ19_01680 [Candidatus Pacearchaeota archaeon]|nr:hypothetical protein [Candidatus Pacearchaeota archaeon]